jgi:predicted CXXCH cytochrome family protein
VLAIAAAAVFAWRSTRGGPDATGAAAEPPPAYIGSAACESCHPDQGRAWRSSQHARAMAEATERTVLGRFDGAQITYAGVTSTFFRRDGRFYVRTDGADGRLDDFEIKYTFGVYPLQQYLVPFPGGRLQALSLAWDARPSSAGGQRWFHLYEGDRIVAGDPLHWTGGRQNWNFTCADCHSTNVRKRYDAAARRYETAWSEISVGCEACHGPGEAHEAWAKRGGAAADARPGAYLTARLDERKGVAWTVDPSTGQPVRNRVRATDREIETCARCHARRAQITDAIQAGDPFEDGFRASLLEPALFHDDGQQNDEVYTYASFLQSRMYAKGVTCSDCHDPHAGTLKASGNAVCTRCHAASGYDATAHHAHDAGSPAAACVACHMPAKTYMVVDPRRDHSFRIPRPDLSAKIGVPDVCTTACHQGRTAAWAAAALDRRENRAPVPAHPFADVFHRARDGSPQGMAGLQRLASSGDLPAIVRASALDRLSAAGHGLAGDGAPRLLADPSSLVRRAAVAALGGADPSARARLAAPLLSDSIRSVRTQAALTLLDAAPGLPAAVRAAFDRALDEYLSEQRFNGDRPEAQTNLGTALATLGRPAEAMAAFREAIALDRTFVPAYVNLADVQRALGQEAEAERVLREAIAVTPAAADAHHALGLALVRQRRIPEALASLAEAVRLQPDAPRLSYVYAVALHDTGSPEKAIDVLEASIARHPYDRDTLYLLASYALERGTIDAARKYADLLSTLDPDSADLQALQQQVQAAPRHPGPRRDR